MLTKYCFPIIKNSKAEVISAVEANRNEYDFFEIWLDYIDDVDTNFVKMLSKDLNERLILLFRRQKLEEIKLDLAKRLEIMVLAHNTDILMDLDVTTQQPELEYIKTQDLSVKTIVSYHDYEQTPNIVQLEAITDTMKGYGPAIYKFSTLCNKPDDGLQLLSHLLSLKTKGLPAIVQGMGELGAVTRVFGALWGNEMTFAPLTKAEASAPGQLTKEQMETIIKELGS